MSAASVGAGLVEVDAVGLAHDRVAARDVHRAR